MKENVQSLLLFEKVLILKSLELFSETPEVVLSELVPLMEELELEKEAVLFRENEPGDSMYIIYKGEVMIQKSGVTLAVLKENEVFGELSLLDAETRSATAVCHTDCFLFRLDQEPLFDLMESRPEIAKGFIKILSRRLRKQNEQSVELSRSPTP